MDHGEVAEKNKYDPLKTTGQTQNELIEEEKSNDEHGSQLGTGQSQGSRQTGQLSKGKALTLVEEKAERLKRGKEEDEFLRQSKKEADEERLKIEKQKQMEIIEKLKMKMYEDEELRGKQKLHNAIRETEKIMKKRLHLSAPSTDSTITNVVQGQGEASVSSGSVGGVESNENETAIPIPSNVIPPAPADKFLLEKCQYKFLQIKDLLKRMQENLNELKQLEHNWLREKSGKLIKKLGHEMKSSNSKRIEITKEENEIIKSLKPYLNLIEKLTIEEVKLKKFKVELKELKENMKNFKKKYLLKKIELKDEKEKKITEQLNIIYNLEKDTDKYVKLLMDQFKKEPETEAIKAIQKKMEEPLKNLWNFYNLVLLALNQVWNEPGFRKHHGFDELHYHYIDYVFHYTPISPNENNKNEFDNTMILTLEKMLLHQNIYRTMNMKTTNVNGKSISVYERLNCFDELTEKMHRLAIYAEGFREITSEYLKKLGKFIKEQVNEHIRESLRFIMVGLDEVPEVGEQMALDGIEELSQWLPQNRKRQMDEVWIRLFKYYEQESENLDILSQVVNDELAEDVFELMPADKEEQDIRKELTKINKLDTDISEEFSNEIITFMKNVVFSNIKQFIHSVIILVKIEKRMNDAKPLPYLKSVYDKYWFKIYKNRFNVFYAHLDQYHFGRGINQTDRAKIINELLAKVPMDKNTKMKPIFRQITHIKPEILNEMMKIIDEIDEFVNEKLIKDRVKKYEKDEDFMKSVANENPNLRFI